MVELVADGVDRAFDFAVINEVALLGIDFPRDNHFDFERVPVQPAALVPLWKRRQKVSRLESERFGQACSHGAIVEALAGHYTPRAVGDQMNL